MSTRVEEDPLPYYVNVVTGLIPKWCWRQALFQTGYSYSSKEICEVQITSLQIQMYGDQSGRPYSTFT